MLPLLEPCIRFTNTNSLCPDPNRYYHVSCIERIFGNLSALVETGNLKMEEKDHEAIEDWFKYRGRTFDVSCYDSYAKGYEEWEDGWTTPYVDHQLSHSRSHDAECEVCQSWRLPEKPKRSDFFPDEPSACLLSEVLAQVAETSHIDGLPIERGESC